MISGYVTSLPALLSVQVVLLFLEVLGLHDDPFRQQALVRHWDLVVLENPEKKEKIKL